MILVGVYNCKYCYIAGTIRAYRICEGHEDFLNCMPLKAKLEGIDNPKWRSKCETFMRLFSHRNTTTSHLTPRYACTVLGNNALFLRAVMEAALHAKSIHKFMAYCGALSKGSKVLRFNFWGGGGGGNCPPRPPSVYGPGYSGYINKSHKPPKMLLVLPQIP